MGICSVSGMGIKVTSNLDGAFDDFTKRAVDAMHEQLALGLAEQMREMGRDSANNVELELESDTDDPKYRIDPERVRRRANEILAAA